MPSADMRTQACSQCIDSAPAAPTRNSACSTRITYVPSLTICARGARLKDLFACSLALRAFRAVQFVATYSRCKLFLYTWFVFFI